MGGMDPITLILSALAAGASAGGVAELQDEAKAMVKAAYGKLRDLLGERFRAAGTPHADGTLADYEDDPETYQKGLAKKLTAAGADTDDGIVSAAQALLDLVGSQGLTAGKYTVTITGSKGVQVGDHNTQTNTF
jgi:roadblock/LC7 domain-containing protein